MRTHIEFRTDKFPAYPDEEEKINPGRWGQRLSEYLQVKLKEHGITTNPSIGFEDWGCIVNLMGTPFDMWIGCGNYEEYSDGHMCFIEPSKSTIWKFPFKRIDTTTEVNRIADVLEKILKSDPDIRAVSWWAEGQNES